MRNEVIRNIIRSYEDPVIRSYCWIRFAILRQRFLDAIEEHLPERGEILDVGCGFGLFSQYYATTGRNRRLLGIDLSARRIALARSAAARLRLTNVRYDQTDVRAFRASGRLAAAYMLDIVHHLPRPAVRPVLEHLRTVLPPDGVLLVKDVDRNPAAKRWFTWALDKAMAPLTPVDYWHANDLAATLDAAGFAVTHRRLPDFLPYPHVLFVCRPKPTGVGAS